METNPQSNDPQETPALVKVRARTFGMSVKAYLEKGEREKTHKSQLWERLLTPRKLVCVVEAKLLVAIETEASIDSESSGSVTAFLQKILDLAGAESGVQIDESFESIEVKVHEALDGKLGPRFGTIKDGQLHRRSGRQQATLVLDDGE